MEQSLKDCEKGFCTPPLSSAELQRHTGGQPFRLFPRCVIVQSSARRGL